LGVSNIHLKDLERGFSFENSEATLDMRLDPINQGVSAADLLNVLRNDQLEEMFKVTLDGGPARWLTSRVIETRNTSPFKTVGDLLEVCHGIKTGKPGLNPATLPFLALRIAVNSELDNLKEGLIQAFDLLEKDGRLAVISFHSKEDEIVKDFIADKRKLGVANLVTFKPVVAGEAELQTNRRARSAKMRVIVKI
jgi:16S rRNA (cytosine1402-N4)-methyltransferase